MGAIFDEKGGITLTQSDDSKSLAWGVWHDSLNQMGWSSLSMHISEGNTDVDDGVKMYAAGVVEGYMTAERIREFHHNSRELVELNSQNHERLPKLKEALHKMLEQLADAAEGQHANGDTLDGQARYALLQTWGVRDGYALAVQNSPTLQQHNAQELSMVEMFILNSDGVIDELLTAYGGNPSEYGDALLQRTEQHALRGGGPGSKRNSGRKQVPFSGHCTGVVRLTSGNSELYFGHTTWEAFSEMTRIWKVYDFPLKGVAARKISFSSYPGCISSTDDYYLMDSGLAITETTLNIPAQQTYSPSSSSMPDFIRIMASNRLAADGPAWVKNMIDTTSGTYSSQWLVVDYKKFAPGQDLPEGTFQVLEQAPGVNHAEDMSSWLQREGYWASYDRAFFDDVRASTGDAQMMRKRGPEAELYSKQGTPRAQIVRQTAGDIVSLEAMRSEMTRNLGTHEPVDEPELQIPRYSISARDDLEDNEHSNPDGSPDGGVDAKITSSCLFKTLTAQAISSPSHTSLPVFRWTQNGMDLWPGFPHEGLPDEASFEWVRVDAQDEMLNMLDNEGCS